MTTTALVDYRCERPDCDAQTVWPEWAAARGWFVIVDRAGRIRVVCPQHSGGKHV